MAGGNIHYAQMFVLKLRFCHPFHRHTFVVSGYILFQSKCLTSRTGSQTCSGKLHALLATHHWSSCPLSCCLEYLIYWFLSAQQQHRGSENGSCLTTYRVRVFFPFKYNILTPHSFSYYYPAIFLSAALSSSLSPHARCSSPSFLSRYQTGPRRTLCRRAKCSAPSHHRFESKVGTTDANSRSFRVPHSQLALVNTSSNNCSSSPAVPSSSTWRTEAAG